MADGDPAAEGVALFNAGDYSAAAAAFRRAAAAGDRSDALRVFLAHALEADGRAESAARLLRRLRRSSAAPDAARELSSLLLRMLARPDCRRPAALAREAARVGGAQPEIARSAAAALVERGRAALASGRPRDAARLFRHAQDLDGASVAAARCRATAASALGRWSDAEAALRCAQKLGEDVAVELAQTLRERARADLAAGRLARAENALRESLRLSGGEASARLVLAEVLRARAQRAASSRSLGPERVRSVARMVDEALALDGRKLEAARWHLKLAGAARDWSLARAELRRARALGEDVETEIAQVLRERGRAALAAGRLEEAELALREGSTQSADLLSLTLQESARRLSVRGRLEKAVRRLEEAVRSAPADEAARRALSDALLAMSARSKSGSRFVDRALALWSGRKAPDAREAGRIALAAGRFEEAVRALRPARPGSAALLNEAQRALAGQRARARLERGRIALAAGRMEEAIRELRPALPGSADLLRLALQGLARRLATEGKLSEAADRAEAAFRLAPRDPAARRTLADVLHARCWRALTERRLDAARAYALRARRVDPAGARAAAAVARSLRRRADEAARWPGSELRVLRWREHAQAVAADFVGREKTLRALAAAAPQVSVERFSALMGLGRYEQALEVAERILDRGASPAELWDLANPWYWEDWTIRQPAMGELARDLGRRLPASARRTWLAFYRVALQAPGALDEYRPPSGDAERRYGWMCMMTGRTALVEGRLGLARRLLAVSGRQRVANWRGLALLAEITLVRADEAAAWDLMDRAAAVVPPDERALLMAWRGAFQLWLGDYARAYKTLDEACRDRAPHAYCWRGAASLLLGEPERALRELDETLRLWPGDLEAYVWRAETKLALGRPDEALDDLSLPSGFWVFAIRALAKGAAGDEAGLLADFGLLPGAVARRAARSAGLARVEDARQARRVLERMRALARGWRREEYGQALWLGRVRP